MGKKTKDSQSVIYSDGDDTFSRHAFAVISWFRTIAGHKPATVEIDQHRKFFIPCACRCPNIQVQTILVHAVGAKIHIAEDIQLHRPWTKLVCFAYAAPILDSLWFSPA